MVRRGAVETAPERVARPGRGRAHVGVRVVPVDPPGVHDALVVNELVAGPADVVHDLVAAALLERLPDARGDVVERLVPADALPLAPAPGPNALHRVAKALGILDLVQGVRPLRAVPAAAARVLGVPLELLNRQAVLVDVGQQPAGSLAVEADGGNQPKPAANAPRPGLRVVLLPVLPALDGWVACEAAR